MTLKLSFRLFNKLGNKMIPSNCFKYSLRILTTNLLKVIIAIRLISSLNATPADCTNSPIPKEFWLDAQSNLSEQPEAKLALLQETSANTTIPMLNISESANISEFEKFAAFYLPPSVLIDNTYNEIYKTMAKDSSVKEPISVLQKSTSTILLVSTNPKECKFLLLVPTGSKSTYTEESAQLTIQGSDIEKLVDSLFIRFFPNAPITENIIDHGITDPIYKWRFSKAMQKPFIVNVSSNIFTMQSSKLTAKTNIETNFPSYLTWQTAITRFSWPSSFRSLTDLTQRYWPLYIQILKRSNDDRGQNLTNEDLSILHNLIVELKPLGDVAKEELGILLKMDVTSLSQHEMAQYGEHLMSLERVISNEYDLMISNSIDLYETLYNKSIRAPVMSPLEPFNSENLLKYRSKYHSDTLNLAPLKTNNLKPLTPEGLNENPTGNAYIIFKDFRDPNTQNDLVQVEIIIALSTESLLNKVSTELNAHIPVDTCSLRYNRGPLIYSTDKGSLIASADVQLQVRACITHDWVCFKGWVPHLCHNTIKTDLFKIHDTVSASLNTQAGDQVITTSTAINVPYRGTIQNTKPIPFKKINNFMGLKNRLSLQKTYFTKNVDNNETLWILDIYMEPIDILQAQINREIIKAILNLENE